MNTQEGPTSEMIRAYSHQRLDLSPSNPALDPATLTIKPKGTGGALGAALSPQDEAAIQWAKQNPSDPRAAKIMALHGGQ